MNATDRYRTLEEAAALGELSRDAPTATTSNPAWFDQRTGAPTTERRRLHEQLLDHWQDQIRSAPRRDGLAIATAGPGGGGKTSLVGHVCVRLSDGGWRTIDHEDFRRLLMLVDLHNGTFAERVPHSLRGRPERVYPAELGQLYQREGALLHSLAIDRVVRTGENMVIGGNMTNAPAVHDIVAKITSRYAIHIVDVEARQSVVEQRLYERWYRKYAELRDMELRGADVSAELGPRFVPGFVTENRYPNGPDRSVCQDVAFDVFASNPAVVAYERYAVDQADAAPALRERYVRRTAHEPTPTTGTPRPHGTDGRLRRTRTEGTPDRTRSVGDRSYDRR